MELSEITERVRIIEANARAAKGVTVSDANKIKFVMDQAETLRKALEAEVLVQELQQVIEEVKAGVVEPWRNLRSRLETLASAWDPF